MATVKKVIILERSPERLEFRYALWGDVPAARQEFFADPARESVYKDASAAEITALQNGSVAERVGIAAYPAGTAIAVIQTELANLWTAFQAELNVATNSAQNPYQRYGTTWDGTTWTLGSK